MKTKKGMCGSFTTRIGKYDVPVKNFRNPSLAKFDDGYYAFWTCVFKKKVDGKGKTWGRAQVGLSAGDRFDRMNRERHTAKSKEDRKWYDWCWKTLMKEGKNVSCVRPSTVKELKKWMKLHPDQKKYFKRWL